MRCSVTLLRKNGLRLKSSELEPPVFGELTIRDSEANGLKRQMRVAMFKVITTGTAPSIDALIPIFDPVVTSIGENDMAISGMQLQPYRDADDEIRISEHVQVWWVRHIGMAGA